MTSKTVFARGCQWCSNCLHDGWGEGLTDDQIDSLADLVVKRFEELCAASGDPSISWHPRTSEVIGECYGETGGGHHWSDPVNPINADLDELREQATQEVWEALCGYTTPMSAFVREALNRELTVTEAANIYRVPRASITLACRDGSLPAKKRRAEWVIWSNDFEDWRDNRPGRGNARPKS